MEPPKQQEVGIVQAIKDYLLVLDGLPSTKINDLLVNDEGVRAVVTSLNANQIKAQLLDYGDIKIGQLFKKTDLQLSIPVGDFLLGRTINPLGIPIDGKANFAKSKPATLL